MKKNFNIMRIYILLFLITSLTFSCNSVKEGDIQVSQNDTQLEQALRSSFPDKGKESLILPNSNELDKIPQDAKNLLTT